MKQRILSFITSKRYAIIWTACYVFAMWAILRFLFNFSMFSGYDWWRLAHAHLRGFAGFVFGLMILAALPLYIATTAVIVRTGKPLVTVPLPKLARATPAPAPAADAAPDDAPPAPTHDTVPAHIPRELQAAFMNVRRRGIEISWPAADAIAVPTPTTDAPTPAVTDSGDMPLPPDFDIPFEDDMSATAMPMFKEISFDAPADTPTAPADADTMPSDVNTPVLQYLKSIGRDATVDGDLVISGDMAIATHADNDFWVADEVAWFASGKQRPSPVAALQAAAATRGLRPVLYLAATNIMDLENITAQWHCAGIRVITDITDLA